MEEKFEKNKIVSYLIGTHQELVGRYGRRSLKYSRGIAIELGATLLANLSTKAIEDPFVETIILLGVSLGSYDVLPRVFFYSLDQTLGRLEFTRYRYLVGDDPSKLVAWGGYDGLIGKGRRLGRWTKERVSDLRKRFRY